MSTIDTEAISRKYREAAVRLSERSLLVTNFHGTEQEADLSEPANCDGVGRVRHFRRSRNQGWMENPLPIEPAARALGLPPGSELRSQVFQNAVCNWRCWYCYVPFDLLSAHARYSAWRRADELVDLYCSLEDRPPMIDLSGGQPDLVPEWVSWTMDALEARGVASTVYLWSDDNLSNDYFWRFLSPAQRHRISTYRMYGRVCCFKGIDGSSFAFNTMAREELFGEQFVLFKRLLELGLDLYAYVTFTVPDGTDLRDRVVSFADRLQRVHPNLPLRTIPLEVETFTPVRDRIDPIRLRSLSLQHEALGHWLGVLEERFPTALRKASITDVPLV